MPIVEQDTTTYQTTTVQNTIIANNTSGTPVRSQQPEVVSIVYQDSSDSTGSIILGVVLGLFILITMGLMTRCALNMSKKAKIEEQVKVMQKIQEQKKLDDSKYQSN